MAKTAADMVREARQRIESLTPEAVAAELAQGEVLLIDLREAGERTENGAIRGALAIPRGLLEFHADPTSPSHQVECQPHRRVIVHCASGGRSALAAETLRQMGYERVAHMEGGFAAWLEAGLPTDPVTE